MRSCCLWVLFHVAASAYGIWFSRSWHFAFPEDGTLVPKQVGEAHLVYVPIRIFAVSRYN
jgi:hypothetical protein